MLDPSNFVINMDLFLNEGLSMCQQEKRKRWNVFDYNKARVYVFGFNTKELS